MSDDFLNLLERLVSGRVDFVIAGGFAGVVHGCTYVTQIVQDFIQGVPVSLSIRFAIGLGWSGSGTLHHRP
jgi:hypothetical protein